MPSAPTARRTTISRSRPTGRSRWTAACSTFTDAVDLTTQLASHPAAQRCYAQRWMDYALGVPVDPSDPEVSAILDRFERDDRVLGLLEAIVSSEMF